ncbi:hypothetical protein GCM10022237_06950 [Nocardioides ginsengisoli]
MAGAGPLGCVAGADDGGADEPWVGGLGGGALGVGAVLGLFPLQAISSTHGASTDMILTAWFIAAPLSRRRPVQMTWWR